jgi:hypothetical protein
MYESNKIDPKKLNIATNKIYFIKSLLELLNIVKLKSESIQIEKLNKKNKNHKKIIAKHKQIRQVCEEMKRGFPIPDNSENNYDQGIVIKKIYKVISQNMDKFYPQQSKDLFLMKNEVGEKITVINGLDLEVVINLMTEEEIEKIWDHLYMLYISSVVIITEIKSYSKDTNIWKILPEINEKIIKSGKYEFNPFIGINIFGKTSDDKLNNDLTMDKMYENLKPLNQTTENAGGIGTGPSLDNLLDLTGIDKLVDFSKLNEQLKNVQQEEIETTTETLTKLLGAENDTDIQNTVKSLLGDVVNELKENPVNGFADSTKMFKNIAEKCGQRLDKEGLRKTAMQFGNLFENSEEKLKELKDENGNPIGEHLMESLKGPLNMLKNSNGKMPNMADMMGMVSQFASTLENMKKK